MYLVAHQTVGSRSTCLHPRARTADSSFFSCPAAATKARNSGESFGVSVHCRSLIWRLALSRHEGAQPELAPMFTNGLKASLHPHVTGHQSRARSPAAPVSAQYFTASEHIGGSHLPARQIERKRSWQGALQEPSPCIPSAKDGITQFAHSGD